MHKRNIEGRSGNRCCRGSTISITRFERVFVALAMQHANRMRHIVAHGLSGSTVFFPPYLIHGKTFEKKLIEHIMCVFIFFTTSVWNIWHSKKNRERFDQKCSMVFM
jgi:hypothetical protein